jgi:hypothetical protein
MEYWTSYSFTYAWVTMELLKVINIAKRVIPPPLLGVVIQSTE